jgi:hypothetical protein
VVKASFNEAAASTVIVPLTFGTLLAGELVLPEPLPDVPAEFDASVDLLELQPAIRAKTPAMAVTA